MTGLNKCSFIGNLGADPEIRHTQSGQAVANFNIAVNSKWTDKQSGEKKEHTEWVRIVLWSKLAEIASQYLKKGNQIYVEGEFQTRKWTDQAGVERYTTEIRGRELRMLGGRQDGGGSSRPPEPPVQDAPVGGGMYQDDDIPFF